MRLIDADELKEYRHNVESGMSETIQELILKWNLDDDEDEVTSLINELLNMCDNIVDTEPTVDAVEVTRCKDCVIRNSQIGNDMYGFCGKAEDFVGDDDYCSAGKQKDGAE